MDGCPRGKTKIVVVGKEDVMLQADGELIGDSIETVIISQLKPILKPVIKVITSCRKLSTKELDNKADIQLS